jgi:hypothetical protein
MSLQKCFQNIAAWRNIQGKKMNEALAVRQELRTLIDGMPERNLYALRPLLNVLAGNSDDILSDEDRALFEECKRDLIEHPENFVSLDAYKKKRGVA